MGFPRPCNAKKPRFGAFFASFLFTSPQSLLYDEGALKTKTFFEEMFWGHIQFEPKY
jgi:hypothetical protein